MSVRKQVTLFITERGYINPCPAGPAHIRGSIRYLQLFLQQHLVGS